MSVSLVLGPPPGTPLPAGAVVNDGSGRDGVNYQGTVWGSPIPISAGYRKIAGRVTWAGPLIKANVKTTVDSSSTPPGVFGTVLTTTITQTNWELRRTFAVDLGKRLNPEADPPKVRRVWADNTLVYSNGSSFPLTFSNETKDYSVQGKYVNGVWVPTDPNDPAPEPPQLVFSNGSNLGVPGVPLFKPIKSNLTFRFYDGSATQLPDPALVADLGPLATAFRRHMYMVIEGLVVGTGQTLIEDNTQYGAPAPDVFNNQNTVPPKFPTILVELVDGNDTIVTGHDFIMAPGATPFEFPDEVVLANFDTREVVVIAPNNVSAPGFLNIYDMDSSTQTACTPITGTGGDGTTVGPTGGFACWDKLNDVFYTERSGDHCIVSLGRSGELISSAMTIHFNLFPETSTGSTTITLSDPATCFPRPTYGDVGYVLENGSFLPCVLAGTVWVAAFCPSPSGVIPPQLIPQQYYQASNNIVGVIAMPLAHDAAIKERLSYQDACFIVSNRDGVELVFVTVRNGVSNILGRQTLYTAQYAGTGHCQAIVDSDGNIVVQETKISNPDLLTKIAMSYGLTADFTVAPGWRGLFPTKGATVYSVSSTTPPQHTWEGNSVRESNTAANTYMAADIQTNLNDGSVELQFGFNGLTSDQEVWDSELNVKFFYDSVANFGRGMRYGQAFSGITGSIQTIGDYVRDIAEEAGFSAADLTVDPKLTDQVPGILIQQPYDLTTLFNDMGAMYDFSYFNSGGKLKFVRSTNSPEKATGGITLTGTIDPVTLHTITVQEGDTVSIGSYIYTFRHTPAAPFDVKIVDDTVTIVNNINQVANDAKEKCAANLLAAIMADLTLAAADSQTDAFFPGTFKNTLVDAKATKSAVDIFGNPSISLTAVVAGTVGNSIITSATGTHINVDHATLQNGSEPPPADITITKDQMCFVSEQTITENDALVTTISPLGQSQQAAAVTYFALEQDYMPAMQTFIPDNQNGNLGLTGATTVTYNLPIIMSTSEAYARVARTSFRLADNVIMQQFRLPQAYLLMEPSDVIAIQIPPFNYTVRADEATFNGDMSTSFAAVNYTSRNDVPIGDSDSRSRLPQLIPGDSDCLPVVIDAPVLNPLQGTVAGNIDLYDGVRAYLTGFGQGSLSFGKVITGQSTLFSSLFTTSTDVKWATVAGTMPTAVEPFYRTVEDSITLNLKTARTSDFSSASYQDFVAGKNCLAFGQPGSWEFIYFRDVTVVNTKTVKLTGLVRAQRGTDAFVTHLDSDVVLLLASVSDSFTGQVLRPQALDASEAGSTYQYNAAGFPKARPPVGLTTTVKGYVLYPFSPCRLKAHPSGVSNDLTLSWLRRDRLNTEFVTDPAILSETTELYDLEILSGTTVVRTVTGLTSPTYTYTTAQQTADGFTPPLASLKFRVYQNGELGRGFPRLETVNVS